MSNTLRKLGIEGKFLSQQLIKKETKPSRHLETLNQYDQYETNFRVHILFMCMEHFPNMTIDWVIKQVLRNVKERKSCRVWSLTTI